MKCRLFLTLPLALAMWAFLGARADSAEKSPERPHVVFITGDCEYRSEISMPMIAKILEQKHGFRCTVCYAEDLKGERKPKYLANIAGLDALETADLAVIFVRFRQLPDDQLQKILRYAQSGKPLVGLRTTTHAFRYTEGPNAAWNDKFGAEVFGQKWIRHHGHDSSTNVYSAVGDHPILRGVEPVFHCRSWLYHVVPLVGDCVPLAIGSAVKGEKKDGTLFGIPSPVAWTKTHGGARVFFTTLGHPEDFSHRAMRRMLIQGILWSLGREAAIPKEGVEADPVETYVAPPTTRAVPDPTLSRPLDEAYAASEEGNPRPTR